MLMAVTNDNCLLARRGILDWSADGSRIVFERQSSPNTPGYDFDLWIVDADGTNLRRLTEVPNLNVWNPSWSPNGKQVAYHATPIGNQSADGQILCD